MIGASGFFTTWGHVVEDAGTVFDCSETIAAGEGIVDVPGGEAVDGATDLVLTFALAALVVDRSVGADRGTVPQRSGPWHHRVADITVVAA